MIGNIHLVLWKYGARLVSMDGLRWNIEIEDHTQILKLERELQRETGRPIDLRLETSVDRNKRKQRTGRE
jgi:hypothetical protein